MIVVSAHQPDLLPYSGFWYKMAKADIFDLKIYDQFVDRGYQRRVKMRDQWAPIPVIGNPKRDPINTVRYQPGAKDTLCKFVSGRYRGAPFFRERSPAILQLIESIDTEVVWQFNLALILGVRDLLGIETPISISVPTIGTGSEGLVSVLRRYGTPLTYLSGTGAKVYMGDCAEFTAAGIDVVWSAHRPVTGDSILTVLMDYDDPMEVVLAEGDG